MALHKAAVLRDLYLANDGREDEAQAVITTEPQRNLAITV
jgi:hypothetical protein